MWRLAVVALAGCQQVLGLEPPGHRIDAFVSPDVAIDASIYASIDSPTSSLRPCSINDDTLVACFNFDDSLLDATGHVIATSTATPTYGAGKLGKAISTDATTMISIGETPVLDLDKYTLEVWVRPHLLPGVGQRAGIVDNNGQYGLFLGAGGVVECTITGSTLVAAAIPAQQWSHLACTFDGAALTAYVGTQAMGTQAGPASTAGIDGTAIGHNSPNGDPFTGDLDLLGIYSVARTQAEICADTGVPSCP